VRLLFCYVFYSVETAFVCVCEMRVESAEAASASAAGEKMDGWMDVLGGTYQTFAALASSGLRRRQPNRFRFLDRARLCVLLLPCGCSFVRVCASIILSSSSPPRSHLSSSFSPSVYFFSAPANPCTGSTCTPF